MFASEIKFRRVNHYSWSNDSPARLIDAFFSWAHTDFSVKQIKRFAESGG
ncbi:hypothetical protein BN136_1901 [Cronobacter universalis NCTC 9529]|nr:hypothetical protein BN136_1901 [Cronobacter universalis NCTC 9529]